MDKKTKSNQNLPSGWRKVKLGEVADFQNGYAFSSQEFISREKNAIPVFKMGNIKEGGGIQWTMKEDYIPLEKAKKLSNFITEPGDILMCMTDMKANVRLLGYCAYIKNEKFLINQRVGRIKAKKDLVDSRFLYFYLNSSGYISYIRSTARSGVQVNLSTEEIKNSPIVLPSLDEQKKIADILSAFDEKIEVNNKIIKTLEEMAQEIFKEWFVRFRFPGWQKVKFVDSELGKIPKGWSVKQIKQVATVQKGISYSSNEISEKPVGVPMLNLANFLRGGGFNPLGIKYYTGKWKEKDLVQAGDIIVAMTDLTSNREVIGHPARVPKYSYWDKIVTSLDVCVVKTKEVFKGFLYYLMMRKDFAFRMASSASGTNVAHLSKSVIEDYDFVLPSQDLMGKFNALVAPVFSAKNIYELENQKLATFRDLLLPKLMNNEIKV